ncbi:Swr1 complex subunit Swc4 [Schizosaccharomyces cryophilus OY26]|uniref:SWR1-complex protein 4 n=1 Tax=Schizosaccharomyces cryophilus (strain OY26 / ATCC MYA-4695 / CBS 11777 / NBRC 106824 / NRRL Y48691) TaxID=653667 RepID=S9W0W3_SCHCR|nr:Swr1 complex subunit Swc4 [Schizosaccharomyces cryophilus OY26]EPY51685.1 Swr1 complex subunit Swc4 [Schizosaccharomyces cryophilus OY26]
MSSADIRDVFELPPPGAGTKQKPKSHGERRPEGVSRELFSLLGENSAPLAIYQKKFKEKPKSNQKAKNWVWHPFKNPTREDDLTLYHWVLKSEAESEAPYKFEKFNTTLFIQDYTEEEYRELLEDEDWSKEETDYLFKLCREFDLRFFVIADRYQWPAKNRTLEDLKDRFYTVSRKILTARNPINSMTAAQSSLLNSMEYNKEQEVIRKNYLVGLASRTPEEVAEEEALFIELKRIESLQSKLLSDREEVLKLLDEQKTTEDLQSFHTSAGVSGLIQDMVNARRVTKAEDVTSTYSAPSSGVSSSVSTPARPLTLNAPKVRYGPSPNDAKSGISWHEKLHSGCFVRSQKIPAVKASLVQKVYATMNELGVSSRLIMPTAKVSEKYVELQNNIVILLELKRQLDRFSQESDIQGRLNDPKKRSASPDAIQDGPTKKLNTGLGNTS